MGCQEENSSGRIPLGQPLIFLRLSPKATKLGSLFPKVKTKLSFFFDRPFEVRASNECKIAFKHLVSMQTRCLMKMQPSWTPLKGVQPAQKNVSDTFLRWTICPPHSIPDSFMDGKHQKPECCSLWEQHSVFLGWLFSRSHPENMRAKKSVRALEHFYNT